VTNNKDSAAVGDHSFFCFACGKFATMLCEDEHIVPTETWLGQEIVLMPERCITTRSQDINLKARKEKKKEWK
jgi:hypothetical protein